MENKSLFLKALWYRSNGTYHIFEFLRIAHVNSIILRYKDHMFHETIFPRNKRGKRRYCLYVRRSMVSLEKFYKKERADLEKLIDSEVAKNYELLFANGYVEVNLKPPVPALIVGMVADKYLHSKQNNLYVKVVVAKLLLDFKTELVRVTLERAQ